MVTPDNRPGVDDGPNSRPLDDTMAQTSPGIPDDAAAEGYDPVADAQTEHDEQENTPDVDEVFGTQG